MEVLHILLIIYSPFMMGDKEHGIKSSTSHVQNFKDWCTLQTTFCLQILTIFQVRFQYFPCFSPELAWKKYSLPLCTYFSEKTWTHKHSDHRKQQK